jgi:putative oxidoreductase
MTMMSPSSHPALSAADRLAANTQDFVLLCGRILMGWIFVRSGLPKLFDIPGVAATYPPRGLIPALAYIAVPVEFFGGLALLLGFATRYVAWLMVAFVLIASFSSHAYWTMTEAAARRTNDSQFWKNMAMLGGLLFLFASGPGALSLDRWLARRRSV